MDPSPSPPTPRHARRRAALVLAAFLPLAVACAPKRTPEPPGPTYVERGIASWYGRPFHGRRTASGERYDMDHLTAAHKTLPFGSRIEVENLDNGRRVQVVINDRGPFVRGRIIDLSRAAAREIEMIGPGTARVEIRWVAGPAPVPVAVAYLVQAGAFRDAAAARGLNDRLEAAGEDVRVDSDGPWHRVLLGPFGSREGALAASDRLRALGVDAWIRPAD